MLSSAWLRWLDKPFGRRRGGDARPPARPRRFFPRLEPLEDRVTPSSADLMVTKTDNTTNQSAVPGKAIVYTITVTNAGPDDLTGATVADPFPATLTGVSFTATQSGGASGFTAGGTGNINDTVNLPNGSSITYTAHATISSAATGLLVNTATAATPAGVTDTDLNNSTATDTVTLTPRADLQVVKNAPPTVTAATPFLFTITVTNAGPSDAQAVSLGDLLPSGEILGGQELKTGSAPFTLFNSGNQITDTIPTLTAGATATITVLAEAKASAANTTVMNTATVSSNTTDPTPGNNSSTAPTTVQAPTITITATLPVGKVGFAYPQTTFTISGGTAPYTLQFTGSLPLGLSFSAPGGSLVLGGTPRSPGTFHFTITATDANGFTGPQAFTLTIQQGNPAFLFFLTQPGSAAVGGFLPTFRVLALDKFGNPLNGVTVSLALVPVRTIGPASFLPGSVLQAVAVNGVATFSHVGVSARGQYQLYAFDAPGIFTYSAAFGVGLLGRHSPFPA